MFFKVLLKISQSLQENTSEICQILKNTYFEEHLQRAASIVRGGTMINLSNPFKLLSGP